MSDGTNIPKMRRSTLRDATPVDRAAIERLLADSALPIEGVAAIITVRPADFIVIEQDGDPELAGVAGLEICGEDGLLRSVAVRRDHRGLGFGELLVERAVERASARGVRSLYLLTTTAADFFPRFGFRRIERSDVPASIAATVEFTSACPASATVMTRALR